VGRKLNRKNIERTAHRKAEGDRKPALFANGKNKEKKSTEGEKGTEGRSVTVKEFGDQVWGSDKESQGYESHKDLLGGEVLHES
jgi:hypothetical protein